VKKSSKPLTEISNITLTSDRRAEERSKFDDHVRAKEAAMEALKEQQRREREEEEKAAVRALRQKMVPKARPMPKYEAPSFKPSEKALTEPHTPNLRTRARATVA
jgi:hypothetical protein